ncbi:transmembrane protein 107 like isoform X2 [Puntigrus tetrazona]|uniref:transmembrane protein 107 like isoform X2 n=1 Tax=Puntigrus tetrazona TaxID=1606681 RepID=UPI001C88E969|nr:transmembrane protein 107 like isoform X2 [Puntigrus tetrazona]
MSHLLRKPLSAMLVFKVRCCFLFSSMSVVSSLVPARFLTLIAHLVIVIIIFWSRESSVRACLPLDYTDEEYSLIVALSVTLGLLAVELVGFLCGVSMFNNNQALLSTGCHASGSVALLFFMFEQWTCSIYWWIFGFCSVIPALYEMILFVVVFGFKRKPL